MTRKVALSFGWTLAFAILALPANRAWAACTAPNCTKIIDNGPDSGKRVVVVMGDGYTSGEQSAYNTQVDNMVTNGMFGNDFFLEMQNAFNVYRLNLNSAQSGVGQRTWDLNGTPSDSSDDTLISTNPKNTALKYLFNGVWSHCWLEHTGSTTNALKNAALAANSLSHADYIIVLLNDSGFGGCNRGPRDIVQTKSVSWQVVGHEAGHGIGGLFDEYFGSGNYTGAAVNNRNCSTVLNRNTVFWNRFISPSTSVPTTLTAGMDSNRTVGEFPGCRYKTNGIYRPVHNCRMKGNTPNFGPVCQTLMRQDLYANLGHDFDNAVVGDFTGDGRDDVLIQNGPDLAIYAASSGPRRLDRIWTANNRVPGVGSSGSWQLSWGDKLYVADFDGDGKDDVYVLNTTSWTNRWVGMLRSTGSGLQTVRRYKKTLPGYGYIGSKDQLFPADFDGDGKDDLYLFSGTSWSKEYMGLLKSSGTSLSAVKRYDDSFPGWIMGKNDKYYVADFNGNGKDDLYVFNGINWGSHKYLGMLRSSGSSLARVRLYHNKLASGWNMGKNDRHYPADINGDGKDDLYVFNGSDWSRAYMELTRSTGTALNYVKRYDDDPGTAWAPNIPGWIMKKGDRHFVADANKDGKEDLFVYNPKINWSKEYLGTLMSSGSTLSGSWSEDWVTGIAGAGAWNLGKADKIIAANYEGGAGKADIFIRNKYWFGMIRRGGSGFRMDRHYHRWIYSPLFDKKPWQLGMP